MNNHIFIEQTIPPTLDQQRLDQALAILCHQYSRSQIQVWIKQGFITVDGRVEQKPRTKVQQGQSVIIQASLSAHEEWEGENIPLNILYEDQDLLIINKPAGLVVHPGAGNPQHTLVNALLHYDPSLAILPRAGLVHRLDKDTSGILVVARNLSAHHLLVKNMQERQIKREYEAIVQGKLISGGVIKTMIGRHPTQRTKMSVVKSGKSAVTHYKIIKCYRAHTHCRIQLETGRTHQIRVHMAYIHHPLVGDPQYGHKSRATDVLFHRQALHAIQLTLAHPRTGEIMSWSCPLPEDMRQLLQQLQEDS